MKEKSFKQAIKIQMAVNGVDSLEELSQQTGLAYQTLRKRIRQPETLRFFEIRCLDQVLRFEDEDLLTLIRG